MLGGDKGGYTRPNSSKCFVRLYERPVQAVNVDKELDKTVSKTTRTDNNQEEAAGTSTQWCMVTNVVKSLGSTMLAHSENNSRAFHILWGFCLESAVYVMNYKSAGLNYK